MVPRVRIPISPPHSLGCRKIGLHYCKESLKIAANSADLAFEPHRRKWPVERHGLVSWRFSLEGTRAVRFQRLHQANAMRSQTDDAAKAP